jgi:hypothetical protein
MTHLLMYNFFSMLSKILEEILETASLVRTQLPS